MGNLASLCLGRDSEPLTEETLSKEPYSQGHLFMGKSDKEKADIVAQLNDLDKKLPAGGIKGYLERARRLLADAKAGVNPFAGLKPKVPQGEKLTGDSGPGSAAYAELEKLGMEQLSKACFCLVAGGLGERLGFPGIKISITSELATGCCFLKNYIDFILAFQAYARKATGDSSLELPLAIMTSGDTKDKTEELLEANNRFGMSESQLTILCQEKVPALVDVDARMAVNGGEVETKPHGHGDVHALLLQKGLVDKWVKEKREWLVLFQDTNPLPFRSICAVLGVSKRNDFVMNSVAVPRIPDEAVGGICQLENEAEGSSLTINVEYNQLDPLLKETPAGGDKPDSSGFSPYPGNINILVFGLAGMKTNLQKTGGIVPEFVNPKWADAEKSKFKKPTRLECMMQDFPKLCSKDQKIGFTQLDRIMCFTCVKNAIEDAKTKNPADCALSAEADIYECNAKLLKLAGAKMEDPVPVEFLGIKAKMGARVVMAPSFGISLEEIKTKVKGDVAISKSSLLVIEGDAVIDGLTLDGALTISSGATVKDKVVKNKGRPIVKMTEKDMESAAEDMKIRGYKMAEGDMEKI